MNVQNEATCKDDMLLVILVITFITNNYPIFIIAFHTECLGKDGCICKFYPSAQEEGK